MNRKEPGMAQTQTAVRKPRTPALIDRVRHHRVALVNCNSYLPANLVRLAKIAGIDRDVALRVMNESVQEVGEWPENVVPITGMSGVIAQVLRDHFASLDSAAGTPASTPAKNKRKRA